MENQNDIGKIASATKALDFIKPYMTIGLGTGSTAAYFIKALGKAVKDGLKIRAVATSLSSYQLASSLDIEMIDLDKVEKIDLSVDGADEIDSNKQMIKGGGGALLREKIVSHMSHEFVVIIDESKLSSNLGHFPLPVEIAPFLYQVTLKELEHLGSHAKLRRNKDQTPFVTDNGNYIADLTFKLGILNPKEMNLLLKNIPGVLETGLFIDMAGRVIIGYQNGQTKII